MKWQFEPPNNTKDDPSHLSYFDDEALDDATSALIREDIQNRLDAKSSSTTEPILIRYFIPKSPLPADKASKWFDGLAPHVNAPLVQEKIGTFEFNSDAPLPYCAIECFKTTGLVGNTEQKLDPEPNEEPQHFFWFLRNVGRSRKKGTRGKWGLGKIVYPASSKLRSFFSYSVEENGMNNTLMGRSVLSIHKIPGEANEYVSEGYGGEFLNEGTNPYWASPCTEADELAEFRKDFRLDRNPDEPGLSIVIPHPKKGINYESIYNALIHQFFWEFLRGTLECVIDNGEGRTTLLDKDTIMDEIQTWPHFSDEDKIQLRDRLLFCKKADDLSPKQTPDLYYCLTTPSSYSNPDIKSIFPDTESFEIAKRKYADNELIAFECPIEIGFKASGQKKDASFLVYLQQSEDVRICDEMYIRDGLTIIGEKCMKTKGIRSLVLAEDPVLSEFLGDSENPAHTKWLESTEHFKGKYKPGAAILKYVKFSASRIANALGQIENEDLTSLLEDIFGIDELEEGNKKKPTNKRGKKKPTGTKDIVPRPKYIATSPLIKARGFKISPDPDATDTPDEIFIAAAFDTEYGNPLNSYHPADFDFSGDNLNILCGGCNILEANFNEIILEIVDSDFTFSVTGFQGSRDIYFRAIPRKNREVL
ncbi:MAG: hypothetical protein H7A51_01750 [Akkermansiaceae bacterium]|nr:hypothetical protein [Akkermansiaceae bacterium]